MSDETVTDTTTEQPAAVETAAPVDSTPGPEQPAAPVPPEPPPPPSTPPTPPTPPRFRPFGSLKPVETPALVGDLAVVTDTDRITFGAIKAAYGWTDKTKLTRAEFLRLRDEWLAGPARKRG